MDTDNFDLQGSRGSVGCHEAQSIVIVDELSGWWPSPALALMYRHYYGWSSSARSSFSMFGWLVRIVAGSWRNTADWFVWEENIILAENLWSYMTSTSQTNRLFDSSSGTRGWAGDGPLSSSLLCLIKEYFSWCLFFCETSYRSRRSHKRTLTPMNSRMHTLSL